MADDKTTTDGAAATAPKPASEAALKPRPPRPKNRRVMKPDPEEGDIQRRDFVWWSMAGWLTAMGVAFARYFFPRALFEPKTQVTIGSPDDFGFGIDTKFQAESRIWVGRNASGLFVILARCTHLGCTPDWKPAENKFKCPCHGSGFDSEGINFEGPAPIPLLRCHLTRDPRGRIVADKLKLYTFEEFKDMKPGTEGPLLAV